MLPAVDQRRDEDDDDDQRIGQLVRRDRSHGLEATSDPEQPAGDAGGEPAVRARDRAAVDPSRGVGRIDV